MEWCIIVFTYICMFHIYCKYTSHLHNYMYVRCVNALELLLCEHMSTVCVLLHTVHICPLALMIMRLTDDLKSSLPLPPYIYRV